MNLFIFKVFRFNPHRDHRGYFQEFEVPVNQGMTVLNGLFYIQERLEGSLAFRTSCRAGVCGSCAMHINGKYRLACETQILDLKSPVVVRPLGHLKVLRDLVVDMEPFWRNYSRIKPYLIPGSPAEGSERVQSVDERERIEEIIDCILCGACYAACPLTKTDEDYLGPAAMLKANRFIRDSRDGATMERLKLIDGEHGVWRCHTVFNCQEACPRDLDPTGAIAELKRKTIARRLGRRY